MEEALVELREMSGAFKFIHQTGEKDYGWVKEFYQREGFEAEVFPFIYEMDQAYAAADLVLCRAGATTLFELMAMGKPAILVPYPYAANDHQTLNALTLVKAGAAVMVANEKLTGRSLGALLRPLRANPEQLKKMGEQAAALAKPGAAEEIIHQCYQMVGHG